MKAIAATALAVILAAGGCGSSNFADPSGATSDSGTSSSSSGGFTYGDAAGSDGSSGGGCATTTREAQKVPLDMVIGLDTSFSMDFDAKWTNAKAALESFVQNPKYADLGVGLQFFPIRKQCSVADYQAPAVALAMQPQAAPQIVQALEAQQMAGGTPMVPLLQGLTAYLRAGARAGRKPVIVLATDGVPDDTCASPVAGELPNTLDNAIAVAAQAYGGGPSIPVFVIGVGTELSALNGIAQAGGTTQATLVDTGGNAQQAFLDALDTARKQAIDCDFAIPGGTAVDPTKINVTYTPASGGSHPFVYVGGESGCVKAPDNGWYFDNELAPTKVVLCAAACDAAKADDRARIDVVFGCPRVDVR